MVGTDAPVAQYEPVGHSCAAVDPAGQKKPPGGHGAGVTTVRPNALRAPVEELQKLPAGQSAKVLARVSHSLPA